VIVPGKASPASSKKHSGLVQKLVNYRQKSFRTLSLGGKSNNIYLNVVNFFNTSVNQTSVAT
jgi:hypothetical protein